MEEEKESTEPRYHGKKIEERFRKFFRGKHNELDEVDFETTNYIYEVKSTKLFRKTTNSNHLRKYRDYIHKRCSGPQLGRFFIKPENHIALYLRSLQLCKPAKYIFVIRMGNQILFKIVPWKEVLVMNQEKTYVIPLKKVFYEVAQQEQRAAKNG